jgi:subtilase family serine protease
MIKRLVIAAVIFGIASLAGLSIGIRSPFAVDNAVIEENDRVVIQGTVPPQARPAFDVGPTDPSLPMKRTILLLKIAPEKQAELDRLVAEQMDPSSPNFHQWLTPEQFGKRFGRTPGEIASVEGWLITHGFTIDETAKGGTWINFSGTAADVDRAFHANMHDYQVNGQLRHANSTDPSIPRALADLVAGPVTLHNFPHHPGAKSRPGYTESDGTHDLAPGDFAAIYDVNSVYGMGYDGAGVTIAIVERTHPDAAKWNTFRSTFGLPYKLPVVTVNGPDPGDLGSDEDLEADLDVEWSGAVATGATINFVTSQTTNSTDGIVLSAQYIVDKNLSPIMSDSFENCEHDLGSTWSTFYYNLWEQAASQGITVFVISGDAGAYSCVNENLVPRGGKAVNGIGSTPFNIAVGGTSLSNAAAYWNPVNSTDGVSALGYMPEVAWNNYNQQNDWVYYASGGGASALWGKPAWQKCPGVPSDSHRDMPDVSLNADLDVGYRVYTCTNATGTTCPSNSWWIIGGTSCASPAFAGIMALIVESAGGERQGNFNSVFYQLANAQYSGASGASPVFHDITSGNNGFGTNLPGYSCTPYYDQVTGLGSVNATNLLLAFWGEGGGLTVTISPAAAITAGAQWNVDGGIWQISGATVEGLLVGSHKVNFNTITGWTAPASQTVNIINGQTTSAGGLYVQQTLTGSLKVTISPTAAVSAGAQWNVDGGTRQNSGATVGNLSVGSHTVNFNTITGWTSPASQTVNIVNGQTTSASATYVLTPLTVESFMIDNGAGITPSRTVTLNNTATGFPTYYIASQSSTFDGAAWKPYSTAPLFTLSGANGPKTVYFKVKNAGGVSAKASDSIVLARLPVVTSFKIDAGAATTINQTVTLNNTATISPTLFRASEDPNFTVASWQAYSTAPKFILSPGGGTKTVYFEVQNSAGLSQPVNGTIELIVKPTVTSFQIDNGAGTTSSRTVTLNNTAIESPTYYMASQSPTFSGAVWKPYSTAPLFTLSAAKGNKTVYFKVRNAAGASYVVYAGITLD